MEEVIFCGIQASGKTTFYRERFFDTHVRISLDLLRTRRREQLLLEEGFRRVYRVEIAEGGEFQADPWLPAEPLDE